MLTTNDFIVAERAAMLRAHGMRRRYYHDELGYNYRMTNLHAAIGRVQLGRLPAWNKQRRQNAAYLSARLQKLDARVLTPVVRPENTHVFHQYTVRVQPGVSRDEVLVKLGELGIATGVYYPLPIHRQQLYLELGYRASLTVTEAAANEVFSLPVHPALTQADLERIAEAVAYATNI